MKMSAPPYRGSYYFLFCIAFFAFWFLFKLGGMPYIATALLSTLIDALMSTGAMIVTAELIMPRFFYTKSYGRFFACAAVAVVFAGTLIIFFQLHLVGYSLADYHKNMLKYHEHYFYWFWSDLVLGSYFLVGFISSAGFAIRLAFDRVKTGDKLAALEKEKIQLELDMLKNQINPHFLFNALNTIYYKIDKANSPARKLTEQFSSLLRYQLTECNDEWVPVEKELEFVNDYVDIQKERICADVCVNCDALKNVSGTKISPYLLMPLVENCFKHVSHFTGKPNVIDISCSIEHGQFTLTTSNTFDAGSPAGTNGIGLANVRKRLEIAYPGRFKLTAGIVGDRFETMLNLDIK